jgi:hypothetical protein
MEARMITRPILEDFELIRVHAAKMRALSEQPGWVLFDTAEYAEQSVLFKWNVDGLSKAARDHNFDVATLAYTKVTLGRATTGFSRGQWAWGIYPPRGNSAIFVEFHV